MKLKIQQKIQLFIITSSILIYIIAIGYISLSARKMAYENAIKLTDNIGLESAEKIKVDLETDLNIVTTLSKAFVIYKEFPMDRWQKLVSSMYSEIFRTTPTMYSIWDSWELNVVDPNYKKPTGRFVVIYWRDKGSIKSNIEYRSLDGDPVLYAEIKKRNQPSIWEPYEDVFAENKSEKFLMTTINSPILDAGKYVGIVAIDITLNRFQKMVEEIKPFEGSYAFLISNQGIIAGHPNKEYLNTKLTDLFPSEKKIEDVIKKIAKGEKDNFLTRDANGKKYYVTFVPITVGNTGTPWSIAVSVPVNVIMAKANKNFIISAIVGVFGLLLLIIIIFIISKNITNPLVKITNLLNLLSKGHIDKKMAIKLDSGDEIEEMANALNESIQGLNKKVDFANHIGAGNLNADFTLLSDDDVLGKSLIEMRNSLLNAKEEDEKRRTEDEKRRWTNEGLAKFAEILRQNNNNLDVLANEIIRNLIYYLNANQGGIFIVNDQDRSNIILELLASFAYNRKKYIKKQIHLGEGLVGACAVEKETIHLTEIPQDYVKITSGLGGSNPSSLLLVPLLIEKDMLGVIELASFTDFKKHEIEFVEKVAESIASTLKSVRINIRTSQLLEQSQQQSEEMAAQEEEMRQNMEELQATQEESARREAEFKGTLDAIDHFLLKAEFSFTGDIIYANTQFLQKFEYGINEIKGLKNTAFVPEPEIPKFQKTWTSVISGTMYQEKMKLKLKSGKLVEFIVSISPVYVNDEIEKIILLAVDPYMY